MAGIANGTLFGINIDFSGQTHPAPTMLLDGQLLIGSTALNGGGTHCNISTLTAGNGISITNGPGSIIITNTGGGGGGSGTNSLMGNSGSATQVGGVINVVGSTNLTTTGTGSTLTITPTLNLLSLAGLAGTGYVVQTAANTFVERIFVAGSGITLTNPDGVAGATTITAGATVPTTFTATAGTATPAANNINFLGNATQGVSSSAAGSTVTYTVANATTTTLGVASFSTTNFTVVSGAVSSNNITVTAGTGLSTGGTVTLGGSVTLALTIPVVVSSGGTGQTTLAAHGVVLGEGGSGVNVTAAGTNGQVLVGGTGVDPAFATVGGTQGVTLTTGSNTLSIGLVNVPNSALANSSITVTAGPGISVSGSPVSLGGTVTISSTGTIATQFSADAGVAAPSGNNVNFLGTAAQGISSAASGSTVTYTVANATTTTKGVASFNSSQFTVTAGAVSLITTGFVETLTPNSGGAVSASSSNINDQGLAANAGGNAYPLFSYNGGSAQVNWENRTYLTPYVVDASTTNGSKGTFTTIAAALTQAASDSYQGDIFIRAGTYTENPTLLAGVNLVAFGGDALTPTVVILGNCTLSTAGTVTISGINLQTNNAACITVSGSVASVLNLNGCNLSCGFNSSVLFNSSSASSKINVYNCTGNITVAGSIAMFQHNSSGTLTFYNSAFTNTGGSSSANAVSSGKVNVYYSYFENGWVFSGGINNFFDATINCASNEVAFNTTASGTYNVYNSLLNSNGVSQAVTVANSTLTLINCVINSTASAGTGAIGVGLSGVLKYSGLTYVNTSTIAGSGTQTPLAVGPRVLISGGSQILSGSGSPSGSITAPQGSLYLRTDGTTINNRAYINTDSGTTWTAITTVG